MVIFLCAIVTFIAMVAYGLALVVLGKEPKENYRLTCTVAVIIFASCSLTGLLADNLLNPRFSTQYKKGFVDAKIGKENYRLEVQSDSTRVWKWAHIK